MSEKDVSNSGIVDISPKNRTISRGRGCWNCLAYDDGDLTETKWQENRTRDLNTALGIVIENNAAGDTCGEKHPKVVQIRAMVELFDKAIASRQFGICTKSATQSDFVQSTYLCDKWSGRQGSSLATSGRPLDKLPDELRDRLGDFDAPPVKTFDERVDDYNAVLDADHEGREESGN